MYLSKFWLFLISVAAALGIGAAMVMPRPAERKVLEAEDIRLQQAREVVGWLLQVDARNRVDLALGYARREIYVELKKVKDDREASEVIAQPLHDSARSTLEALLAATKGEKPSFLMALDAWGRVVARAGIEPKEWGDDLSGYFLVRDALRGYMRDDLWLLNGKLYRVAAAPVITPKAEGADAYVGAIVVGQEIDDALTHDLELRISGQCAELGGAAANCDTHVAFFAHDELIATSGSTTVAGDIRTEARKLGDKLEARDAKGQSVSPPPLTVSGDATNWRVALKRLPGEVGAQDGFYAVYSERPRSTGMVALLSSVVRGDLTPETWGVVGGGFVFVLLVGLLLMWVEADRPIKRLLKDALSFGQGQTKNLDERPRGKFGSIARSVNLGIDRLSRDKPKREPSWRQPVDDDPGRPRQLQSAGPSGPPQSPYAAPPASDLAFDGPPAAASSGFSFDFAPPPPSAAAAAKPARPSGSSNNAMPAAPQSKASRVNTTPTSAGAPPPPRPSANRPQPTMPPLLVEDDLLEDGPFAPDRRGSAPNPVPEAINETVSGFIRQVSTPDGEAQHFRQVYDDFIDLKRKCGEPVDAITFDKFLVKLHANRDQLVSKYACKAVRFQVYVKDGKAALKATPIKA